MSVAPHLDVLISERHVVAFIRMLACEDTLLQQLGERINPSSESGYYLATFSWISFPILDNSRGEREHLKIGRNLD